MTLGPAGPTYAPPGRRGAVGGQCGRFVARRVPVGGRWFGFTVAVGGRRILGRWSRRQRGSRFVRRAACQREQPPAEVLLGAGQAAHHRTARDGELLGNLAVGEAFEVKHQQHDAKLLGEPLQGGLEALLVDPFVRGVRGEIIDRLIEHVGVDSHGALARRQLLEERVAEDGKQPTAGTTHVAQLVEPGLGHQEGLLHQILGIGRRTGEPVAVAIQVSVVLVDQGAQVRRHNSAVGAGSREPFHARHLAGGIRGCRVARRGRALVHRFTQP